MSVSELLRRLVDVDPVEVPAGQPGVTIPGQPDPTHRYAPVLSVYLDLRPQATGTRPALRSGRIVLKDRLREIEKTFFPRGVAFDAVRADAKRIEEFLDTQASPTQGVAIFASATHSLFETLEVGVPFVNEVAARAEPSLFQLTRLLDDHEVTVVAVVDTNTARLFVMEEGDLRLADSANESPKYYRKLRTANGMNQARYQRHGENRRGQFATDIAARIERLVDQEQAKQVLLSGDEVAIPLLRGALSPRVASLVAERPLRLDITTPDNVIRATIAPLIAEAEAAQDRSVVEQLVNAVQAGGLGISGLDAVRDALAQGQVDTLVLAGDVTFPPETRSDLIEQAKKSGADVEIVDGSEPLRALDGVGALLRYALTDQSASA